MKIQEITEVANTARVSRVQGDKVTIDHGDGRETTIDTKRNPDALDRDDRGNITVSTASKNSAMQNNRQRQRPRPGQKVQVSDED